MDPSSVLVKVLYQGSHLQCTLDLIESNFRIHFFLVQTASVFGGYSSVNKSPYGTSGRASGWSILQFCSRKQLEVSLLHPGWDAGPSPGYPSTLIFAYRMGREEEI